MMDVTPYRSQSLHESLGGIEDGIKEHTASQICGIALSKWYRCVTAKQRDRGKAEEKTRREGEHPDWEPLEGDKMKLTELRYNRPFHNKPFRITNSFRYSRYRRVYSNDFRCSKIFRMNGFRYSPSVCCIEYDLYLDKLSRTTWQQGPTYIAPFSPRSSS